MFAPDESAIAYIRRLTLPKLYFPQIENNFDQIEFGSFVEVQVESKDISEAVLNLIFQFLSCCENGEIYHISTGWKIFP